MFNQQLLDYVKQQLQRGVSEEKIRNALLNQGWSEKDIDGVFRMFGSAQPPKPPLSPPISSFPLTGPQQLDPKAVWLFFFNWVFVFLLMSIFAWFGLLALLAVLIGSLFWAVVIWLLTLLVALIFSFVWAKLTYRFYRYELTDVGFRKELGVIAKKYVTIPYDRIQNIDIHRSLLDRILGLSGLNIQTAGGMSVHGGSEGRLPGLSREVAEQLRDDLIQRARQVKNQGL